MATDPASQTQALQKRSKISVVSGRRLTLCYNATLESSCQEEKRKTWLYKIRSSEICITCSNATVDLYGASHSGFSTTVSK